MPGDWGILDCPHCGFTHPPPQGVTTDTEKLTADLVCPNCHKGWEHEVELWRYYGVQRELPSREEDR